MKRIIIMALLMIIFTIGCVGAIASPVNHQEIDNWLSERTYIENEYDCSQYSRDACHELFNDNCLCILGNHNGINHEWVEVNGQGFEPTSGKWILSYWLQGYEPYSEGIRCDR